MISSKISFPRKRFRYVFILFLTGAALISCKQNKASSKALAAIENPINTSEVKNDNLDQEVKALMAEYNIPGVNMALLGNGRINSTRNYGVLQKGKKDLINDETMSSVGSISKVINAILILKLVNEGQLNLDKNVNDYLINWKVKENAHTKDNPVTLRRILSHTAGFSVSGFEDYLPLEEIPNIIQILNGEKPAKNTKVEVVFPVGSKYEYSGGGITVSQKVVEDVTGLSYAEAARQILFEPLNLGRSSYENPLPSSYQNVAKAHDENGNPIALPRGYETMPEQAASGLWTTPTELAKLLSVFIPTSDAKTVDFLSPKIVKDMVTPQTPGKYGLGPKIIENKGFKLIEHGGANDSFKAIFCFYPEKNVGYIVFANGSNGMDLIVDALPIFDAYFGIL